VRQIRSPDKVHEGSFILDMFEKEEESVRPNTVHGDTHAQSTTVFGLAHLLSIALMPRIKNWKDLTLYRPDPDVHYTHLDGLFTDTIDWELIETHVPDMIRVALSIKAGKITPSTILRKLGTYSRKNKLYQAFQELGRVIRTHFLYVMRTQQISKGKMRQKRIHTLLTVFHFFGCCFSGEKDSRIRLPGTTPLCGESGGNP